MKAALQVHHLQKTYKRQTVVKDISLSLGQGEVVGLLGPNGAGKTTSFYMIAGLVPVDNGTITLGDQDITHHLIHARAQLGIN